MGLFLISLFVSSLLAYKNATDFWILILCLATLLNSFISSSSFLVESLSFSMYSIMSFANKENFSTSFQIQMSFISSCLIAVARISSTMLKKRGKSGHPCLVPDLQENTCSFCPLSMMLAVGLSFMSFIVFSYVPSIPTWLRLSIINGCWILSNAFSGSIDMVMWFLSFILFMWWITFIDCESCANLAFPE